MPATTTISHTATQQAPKPRQPKPEKPKNEAKPTQRPQQQAGPPGERKLSAKELKEQKKAEKQARRAADKAAAGVVLGGPGKVQEGQVPQQAQKGGKPQQQQQQQLQQQQQPYKRQQQHQQQQQSAKKSEKGKSLETHAGAGLVAVVAQQESKQIPLFRHLEDPERKVNICGAHKDVHPAILALGQQIASFVICGSNARCVATLHAFKRVIEDYVTPPHTTLSRNLSNHHLSPQIEYLRSARPMSISMRNAIRWLKLEISTTSIDLSEDAAKKLLVKKIDSYIREKITVADQAIVTYATEKIVDGDVIVTYAKSSIVEQVLAEAHKKGISFKAVVVDSRPLLEGKQMVQSLSDIGIDTTYTLIHALSYVVRSATKVFLGAHAMLGNGRLYSRVGTASVAMHAKEYNIPVIVCAESIKFTDKVSLDSIVSNELGNPDDLVNTSIDPRQPKMGKLVNWRQINDLKILNLMYDVTPAENITQVITEYGSLPPSSVPVVHRLSTNQ